MKIRKCFLIGAVVVTLILSTSSSLGFVTSFKKDDENIAQNIEIDNDFYINMKDSLTNGGAGLGRINFTWISFVKNEYEAYSDIRIYKNHVYVSGWSSEDKKVPMVCKLDITDGSKIWKKSLPLFDDPAVAYDIEVFDQGVYVVGYLEYTNTFFLCKIDFDGNILWHKLFTGEKYNPLPGIITDDTHLYLCGQKDSHSRILKMDADGNQIWDKTYNLPEVSSSKLSEIKIYNDFIYGVGQVHTSNAQDFLLVKLDLEGNLIWHQTWGSSDAELGVSIDVKDDYIYAYGFYADHLNDDHFTDVLLKYDQDGVLQWDTNSGIQSHGIDVVVYDGFIYTTGEIHIDNGYRTVLFKYDLDSNLVAYLLSYSTCGRDLEIYDDFLYLCSWDCVLKYDMYQNLDNNKPDKPSTPSGPTNGIPYITYEYTSMATDPDNNLISYCYSWGDGTNLFERWYDSGSLVVAPHKWTKRGNYEIKVRVRDEFGLVSEWSDPLVITMSKSKIIHTPFLRFLQDHPQLFSILRYLLELH